MTTCSGSMRAVEAEEIDELIAYLRDALPYTYRMYNYARFTRQGRWAGCRLLVDAWPRPDVVVCEKLREHKTTAGLFAGPDYEYVALNGRHDKLQACLLQSCDWTQPLQLHGPDSHGAVAECARRKHGKLYEDVYSVMMATAVQSIRAPPPGYRLTALADDDTDYVVGTVSSFSKLWHNRDFVRTCIRNLPSVALRDSTTDRVVAYKFTYPDGEPEAYTCPAHRRRGLMNVVGVAHTELLLRREGLPMVLISTQADNTQGARSTGFTPVEGKWVWSTVYPIVSKY